MLAPGWCQTVPTSQALAEVHTFKQRVQYKSSTCYNGQGITYSQMDRQKTTLMVGLHCNDTAASQDLIQLGGFETTYL